MRPSSGRRLAALVAAGLGVLLAVHPCRLAAQDGVPSSPAFLFLGVSPEHISRPATPQALAAELAGAIDAAGAAAQGFALDFAPWSLIPGLRIPLQDYQSRRLSYMAANTQISLATVRAASAENDTDLGLGLRVAIVNDGDYMADPALGVLYRKKLEECGELRAAAQPGDDSLQRYEACLNGAFEEAVTEWKQAQSWNGNALALALASALRLRDSLLGQPEWLGIGAWITGALKVGTWGQLVGQAEYAFRQEGGTLLSSVVTGGLRALAGGRKFNLAAEYAGTLNLARLTAGPYSDRFSAGAECLLWEGLWLCASVRGSIYPGEPLSLLTSLRSRVLPLALKVSPPD